MIDPILGTLSPIPSMPEDFKGTFEYQDRRIDLILAGDGKPIGEPIRLAHMLIHVGIPSGGNTTIGAALNGFQLRKLPPFVTADMNCDQQVDGRDIAGFVTALLDEEQYRAAEPTCNIDHGDLSGNGIVGPEDINAFVNTVLP